MVVGNHVGSGWRYILTDYAMGGQYSTAAEFQGVLKQFQSFTAVTGVCVWCYVGNR